MKRSTFSEEQIVYAIQQADAGTPVGDLCRQLGVSDAVSSPVKETLLKENFWLQVEPDTWRVGDLPMRHGAVLRYSSATIRR